jgi:hypothetical protein
MKVIEITVPLRLIAAPGQVAAVTVTATTSSVEIMRDKLDRLGTLKILTDQIMREDAELLRKLAKL